MLRKLGVVGKFVEFFGPASPHLPLADRATIATWRPEYGATCGIFPVDRRRSTTCTCPAASAEQIALVEAYAKAQGLWHDAHRRAEFTDTLELDLADVEPSLAGPKRPQDRVLLEDAKKSYPERRRRYSPPIASANKRDAAISPIRRNGRSASAANGGYPVERARRFRRRELHGDGRDRRDHLCTNTSNPSGDARRRPAGQEGRRQGPQGQAVGEDLAGPGSQVVTDYLTNSGLQGARQARLQPRRLRLHHLHRQLRPAAGEISKGIDATSSVGSVLSGNRNFEGRVIRT
jgi:aconitate hydratase